MRRREFPPGPKSSAESPRLDAPQSELPQHGIVGFCIEAWREALMFRTPTAGIHHWRYWA